MTEKEYLPYKAINVFIDREYLESVLETILKGKNDLPKEDQISLIKAFKQHVNILGFRNAVRAPVPLQVNAYASAFEEKNEVIPLSLTLWTKLNQNFAETVKNWLDEDGWEDLALERNFNETEGFINEWPKKVTFEKLAKKFKKSNPNIEFNLNDLILMVLWISGKLPPEQTEL